MISGFSKADETNKVTYFKYTISPSFSATNLLNVSIWITSVIQFSVMFKARNPPVLLESGVEGLKLWYKVNSLSPKYPINSPNHLTQDVWQSVYDCLKSPSSLLSFCWVYHLIQYQQKILLFPIYHCRKNIVNYSRAWKFLHFHLPFS